MEIEQGQVVKCVVDKISGTTVFVNIDGEKRRGTIILSEIAPGRIRNLREYVVPKKTIICKVLKVSQDHIELSLRRVTQKEQKELMTQYKLEKSCESVLRTILKDKTKEVVEKIREEENLYSFLEEAKVDPKKLEKIVSKEESKKILYILNTQKQKSIFLKKEITLKSTEKNGLNLIKEILGKEEDIEVTYLGSGKYSLKTEDKDLKTADNKLMKFIEKIEDFSKKNKLEVREKN
jgi:translation initiation factor 2 alpha subunit (eIF-2alpha)